MNPIYDMSNLFMGELYSTTGIFLAWFKDLILRKEFMSYDCTYKQTILYNT